MTTDQLAKILALHPGADVLLRVTLDEDSEREEGDYIVSAVITGARIVEEISDVPIFVIEAVEEHDAYLLE